MMRTFLRWTTALALSLSTIASGSPAMAQDATKLETKPLGLGIQRAYPNLRVDRPVIIDHANDGSGRTFVASQLGEIFILPKNEQAEEATSFIDLSDRVTYKDRENEEGLLGMAFHPKFKENGEFFVYYTSQKQPHLSTVSRFRCKDASHQQGDPASEEVLWTLEQPFWNHNGGTLCFGPDGSLYIGLGDGGFRDDPKRAGQDLSTWLGKILRIDIDSKTADLPYGIPEDNPFVKVEGAKPEIFALGFRNIWRMSFDRASGRFWVADVGQDLWEEVNVVDKGGNYGWSLKEASHPFHQKEFQGASVLIDPVWEYPHTDDWGKSITGGMVYRGKKLPSLAGRYLYADYVAGKVWALRYDDQQRKVVENHSIPFDQSLPIVTFGEQEDGEVLFSTTTSGGMLYRFVDPSVASK
ncbi:MAG: PQQ-dependent sugar dehydrogenase [Pirellulaceae bacterium]